MNESILDTIKKMLGIDSSYDAFDTDIIVNINAAFMNLYQLGVGSKEGFMIKGSEETWDLFLPPSYPAINGVKNYIYLKTRLGFDPPTSSFVMESMKNTIAELEWRLNVDQDEGGV